MSDPSTHGATPSEAQEGSKVEQANPSLRSIPAPVDGVRSAVSPRECSTVPPHERTALDALKTELREAARNQLLNEIDAWLLDEAQACDVDGAEWDAALYRKVGQDLAERFNADWGDCTAHIGGAGRGIARVENIGLVNPFAIRLLMESLGVALGQSPERRMLRVDERPQWAPGGVLREVSQEGKPC